MTQIPYRSASRVGIHYFPDTLHYRDQDLQTWLPELVSLGVHWITLIAPVERAIPEDFLRGLIGAGIEPILHFPLPIDLRASDTQGGHDFTNELTSSFTVLFSNYARWGVHYVVLFDRPNVRRSWPASAWTQDDLVDRFLLPPPHCRPGSNRFFHRWNLGVIIGIRHFCNRLSVRSNGDALRRVANHSWPSKLF
jgi:hypothetical protein